MRLLGLEAIYQKPDTSAGHPEHRIYPDLLRGLAAWMLPHLPRRPGKPKQWGGWWLVPACEKTERKAHGAQSGQSLLLPWALIRQLSP